jgi:AraC-like DNA-binding protein
VHDEEIRLEEQALLAVDGLEIIRQDTGRFDRRFPVGPVCWPHFDLLWIHEGAVLLDVAGQDAPAELTAPDGILLFPVTAFAGRVCSAGVEASICHFRLPGDWSPGHGRPRPSETLALQAMIVLSLRLAAEGATTDRRLRLVAAILDGFAASAGPGAPESRIDRAWRLSADRLDRIRGLVDVAAQADLSESAFRAAHRAQRGTSAGAALTALRIATAERLLATTALPLSDIAAAVGYGHAETLCHAFRRARGHSPGAWRSLQRPFA